MNNKILENSSKDFKALRTRRTHKESITTRHLQALCYRMTALLSLLLFILWNAVIWRTTSTLWNPIRYHQIPRYSLRSWTQPLPCPLWTELGLTMPARKRNKITSGPSSDLMGKGTNAITKKRTHIRRYKWAPKLTRMYPNSWLLTVLVLEIYLSAMLCWIIQVSQNCMWNTFW
jgi:hypothetical protein